MFTRVAFVFVLSQAACATVQEYPRCYLFRPPTVEEISEINSEQKNLLKSVFSADSVWASRDNVYTKASPQDQNNIRKVWPRSGCVNMRRQPPFGSEVIDKWIVARCQEFLKEYVDNAENRGENYVPPTEIAARYDEFVCH